MDNDFIKYIQKVVEEVFSTMIFIEPEPGAPIKREKGNKIPGQKDITGIVGLGGELTASIVLHFKKESALKITSNMLGTEYEDIDEDVKDAVGEVSNMIAGGVKVELAQSGINLDQSLPIVVTGSDFDTSCLNGESSMLVPFTFESNIFFVEFSFKK
jgi:chemotaxis protein CheX